MLPLCRFEGVGVIPWSPLARGFLAGFDDVATLGPKDIRRQMPRFDTANYAANRKLYRGYAEIAAEVGRKPAQLALAWLLAKGDDIIPIPGTTSVDHLAENAGADSIELSDDVMRRLDALINAHTVVGARYNAATQAEIDTEEFQPAATAFA